MSDSILMVAGEASADLHGAAITRELLERRPELSLWGVGGDGMRLHGFDAVADAGEISVVGLTEVLTSIPHIAGIMRKLKKRATAEPPALAILMDLPDFNMRLAKHLKSLGVPVLYFISPQVWAWRAGRVKEIKRNIDRMLCILPFEVPFYAERGVEARYVGHPLVETTRSAPSRNEARELLRIPEDAKVLALLPGSRRQEVRALLPTMLEAAQVLRQGFPGLEILVPRAPTIDRDEFAKVLAGTTHEGVRFFEGGATECICAADAAVVCSGTATLQTALLGTPMVVGYKTSALTYAILSRIATVEHVALPNIIAGRGFIPELLQREFNPSGIANELGSILRDPHGAGSQLEELDRVRERLHMNGRVASRVCDESIELLRQQGDT